MPKMSVAVLRLRDFRFLLFTRIFTTLALQCQSVIVGWQIYEITKDTFLLGLTGLAEAVPAIGCALIAGHVVDNGKPHKIYLLCVGALVLNTFMLFLIAGRIVPAPGGSLLPWIYGGIFISGLARSFIVSSSFTILSLIVPKNEMAAATAWRSSGFQTAAIAGPALAGIIYGGYGARQAWMMTAGFMLVSFIFLCALKVPHTKRAEARRESAIKSIKAGWKFISGHQVLLSMMGLDMLAVLFGGAVAMLPAYADQVLHVGSEGLGALRAAPALGAVATTLAMALVPMKRVSAVRMLWVVTGFGFCMVGFGLSRIFWLSMLFLIFSGVFDSVSMVIRGTLTQLLTPDDMRGRVSSIGSMFIISSNEIGAFESGTAAKFLGLVPSVVIGGIGTLVVTALVAARFPKLRRTVIDVDGK
ncbi:MAG: MFS transporter [Alphaproteobacteria bacterium]|nr:MFS transporter [Alphaproteobacteria bacterium]